MTHASLHRVVTFPAVLLTLAILAHSACSQAATAPTTLPAPDEPFPILAWGGPPQAQVTPERLRELAEAGINIDYSGFSDAKAMAAALDVAKGAGVKLLVACPELKSDPVGTVNRFKDHPAVGGYFLVDEPAAGAFAELGGWARKIRSADDRHPCYLNLFPNYANAEQLGAGNYAGYVDRFVREVPVQVLSFDHYPVIRAGVGGGATLRPQWYENLEIVSAAARKADKPFWAFALATAHGPYPVPELSHLRVQVYSDLAYGAQAIQYFTYWTPPPQGWDFHEGPITADGRRTAVYDRVRQVNREIQSLRGVFLGAKVESVGHTGDKLPAGTKAYQPAGPVRELRTPGGGAVVSRLSNRGREFLVVVNRDVEHEVPLRVALRNPAGVRRVEKDGSLRAAGGDATLESKVGPGDVAIFAWEAEGRPHD